MSGARRGRFVPVYICPYEGCVRGRKDFLKKNNLYQHYLIHIECKAMCNACDMPFTSLSALIRHARSCGDDFFNSSPRDAKIMVDLIVSCRRKLEEHVGERTKARQAKRTSNRGIRKKSPFHNFDHSEGQGSRGQGALLSPEVSTGPKPDIETNASEVIQENYDNQNGSPIIESANTPNHQPHRWIPGLIISETDSMGCGAQKVHLFEDFTCPHGECSKRKKDWRNRDKLLKHYYSHFSCDATCNTCDRDICSLDSLVVHIDWCKGFRSSSPRAATIRAELMKSCEKMLDDSLAKRFKAGLTVGEWKAHNESTKAQLEYLMRCTVDPKLPFPDHNLSGLQALLDMNAYSPSEGPPASILGTKPNGPEGFQRSYSGDLALLPKSNANSTLCPNYGELPELQQSSSRHCFDAQVTDHLVQRGNQQPSLPETQQLIGDVSLLAQYPNGPSFDIHQVLSVDLARSGRASFDSIVNMDPSFYSQWSTEFCEPLPASISGLNQALIDPATNIDPDLFPQLVNNACNAVPGNKPPMNQAQLGPTTTLDISLSSPLAIPTDYSMCFPAAPDVRKALIPNQINLNGPLFDSSILMDPTLCLPLSSPMVYNCPLHALHAHPAAPAPMLDYTIVCNHVFSSGGDNGVLNENNYSGWN